MLSVREVMLILWPLFAIMKLMAKATIVVAGWLAKAVVSGVRWVAGRVGGGDAARRDELGSGD